MTKIQHEKSSEFLRGLSSDDLVWDICERDMYEYSEFQLLDFAERFANQRVIEELEAHVSNINGGAVYVGHELIDVYQIRIKELKEKL